MAVISSLTWQATSDNSDYIATVPLDFDADPLYTITLQGTVQDAQNGNVIPRAFNLDNTLNSTNVTVSYGPLVWIVFAYTRKTFKLPVPAQTLSIEGASGQAVLYVADNPDNLSDDANLLAIQKASGLQVPQFIFEATYTAANVNQLDSDNGATVQFLGVANTVNYILKNIADAVSPVPNGWFTFFSNTGTQNALLTPFGGQTINSIFTAAKPFVVFPNESGYIQSDGTQWFVVISKKVHANIKYSAANVTLDPNDDRKQLNFNGLVAQTYNIPNPATMPEGWSTSIINTTATTLKIQAPNGVTINNFWINPATILTLNKGDHGELYIDEGGAWHFTGELSFDSGYLAIAPAASATLTHLLGDQPTNIQLWFLNVNPEFGFTAGEEIILTNFTAFAADVGITVLAGITVLVYCLGGGANPFSVLDLTGTRRSMTNANWKWRIVVSRYVT